KPYCSSSGGTALCGNGTGANSYAPTCPAGTLSCSGTTPTCGATNPAPSCMPYAYPYVTGHFREIKNNSDFTLSTTNLSTFGDCTAAGTALPGGRRDNRHDHSAGRRP